MLLIGEVAQRAGVATSAIRYYEELGLIEPAGRDSGRRLFPESAPRRLRAITAAREAGFSLAKSSVSWTATWKVLTSGWNSSRRRSSTPVLASGGYAPSRRPCETA